VSSEQEPGPAHPRRGAPSRRGARKLDLARDGDRLGEDTAIEKLADRVNLAVDPQIGRVKDMGSAAVGLALLIAGMTWLLALAERFGLI